MTELRTDAYIYWINEDDYRIDAHSREEADEMFYQIFDRLPTDEDYKRRQRS